MDKDLMIIQDQLVVMKNFMRNTPDDNIGYHTAEWWVRDLPWLEDSYTPVYWQQRRIPIYLVWEQYLNELKCTGLHGYCGKARQLEIKELLAASQGADNYEVNHY